VIDAGTTPVVPGLVLDVELGRGRFGPVWRAVDLGTGEPVAVRVGRPAGGVEAVAREGALLRRLHHENVAGLRSVVDLPGSASHPGAGVPARAVVVDLVPGGSLAALLARRGPLPSGEVATVAVGVARALAYLHAHGFVHGRLSLRDVLFDTQGRPVVADVGVASLLAPVAGNAGTPSYPSPADDVLALGRLLRDALVPGGPLDGLVADCLAADPARRPTPDRVAQLAARFVPPRPVDLSAAAPAGAAPAPAHALSGPSPAPAMTPAPAPAVPGWRPLPGRPPSPPPAPATHLAHPVAVPPAPARPPQPVRVPGPARGPADADHLGTRRLVVAGGVVLAVAGLVAAALALALRTGGGDGPPPATTALGPSASPSATPLSEVAAVVGRLAAARAAAFSSASEDALGGVDAPGSAALDQDRAFVRRLHAAGVRLEGLRFTVGDVGLVAATDDGVTVEARVAASAYRQVRPDGTVARTVAAQEPRRVQLTLVRVGDAWRVSAVV
jgi:hypothetical protein